MTNLYAIVGERPDDPAHFLVLGADGQYYEWDLTTEAIRPVTPGAEWQFDAGMSAVGRDFEAIVRT